MPNFKWGTHHDSWTSNTLQRIVHTSTRLLHHNLLDKLAVISWVYTVCRSKLSGFLKLVRVDVNPDDPSRHGNLATHDGSQPDSSKPKNSTRGIFFNLNAQKLEASQLTILKDHFSIFTDSFYSKYNI